MKHWLMLWGVLAVSTVYASDESFQPSSESSSSRSSSLSVSPSLSPETPKESPLKKQKITSSSSRWLMREDTQVYAIPTYDATFKYLLSDEEICLSFLQAFIPDHKIQRVKLLDRPLWTFEKRQALYDLINDQEMKSFAQEFQTFSKEEKKSITVTYQKDGKPQTLICGARFFTELSKDYPDIRQTYPEPEKSCAVNTHCYFMNGTYALVKIKLSSKEHWDEEILSDAARIYGRQSRTESSWEGITKLIYINLINVHYKGILGLERPYFRRLTLKDRFNKDIENGIEILHYPLHHDDLRYIAELRTDSQNQTAFLEWLELFEDAFLKSEKGVAKVKTQSVRKAYEKIKLKNLPKFVQEGIKEQDDRYIKKHYSKALARAQEEGRLAELEKVRQAQLEEKKDTAREMLQDGESIEKIMRYTKLSLEQIQELQAEMASQIH